MHRIAVVAVFGLALVISASSQAGWEGQERGSLGASADYSILHLAKKNQGNSGHKGQHKKNNKEGKNNNPSDSESSGSNPQKTDTSSNPPPASSGGNQSGDVPAATLLLPYFEVDTNKPGGGTLIPKSGK